MASLICRRGRDHAQSRRVETRLLGPHDAPGPRPAQGTDLLVLQGDELGPLQSQGQALQGPVPIVLRCGDRWIYQGHPLPFRIPASRRQACSTLLRWVYADSPRRWQANRATRLAAVELLSDFSRPLWIPEPPVRGRSGSPSALLHEALIEPGLLRPLQTHGNASLYEVCDGPGERAEGRLFGALLERLYGEARLGHSIRLQEMWDWLAQPPRGVRGLPARLYLTAALRAHSQDLHLLGPDGESLALSSETLERACRAPRAWRIGYHPATPLEQAFLLSLIRMWGGGGGHPDRAADLWTRAARALGAWYRAMPGWTRASLDSHSPNAQTLARLGEQAERVPPRELIAGRLLHAFRVEQVPRLEEQGLLLDRLESARLELEGFLHSQHDLLATQMHRMMTGDYRDPQGSRSWLDLGCRDWLSRLPSGTLEREGFSAWAWGLRAALVSNEAVEQRWFVELPARLELPAVRDWQTDHTRLFLARLARALLELKLWNVLQLLPLPANPAERQRQLGEWTRETLHSVGLSAAKAEQILFELLEELVAG